MIRDSVRGYVETISADRCELSGWLATDEEDPQVILHLDGAPVARGLIGQERRDVASKIGLTCRSFTLSCAPLWPGALTSGSVGVSVEGVRIELARGLLESEAAIHTSTVERLREGGHGLLEQSYPPGPVEVSRVPFPLGSRSTDGSGAIGRDGHLFLLKGSNFLARRYRRPGTLAEEQRVEQEVDKWCRLVRDREKRCGESGAQFLQLIVPEKSSSLDSGIPELEGVTVVLERLDERLADDPSYLSGLEVLGRGAAAGRSWLRLDTHVSTAGALKLFTALLERADLASVLPEIPLESTESHRGDLSRRFFGTDIGETDLVPRSRLLEHLGSGVDLVESSDPPAGENRWLGMHRVWQNEHAPIPKKVVVFGNSYFGDPARSARLNWWFTRFFREHHFFWAPAVDHEYVRRVRPDVVIAQTVERFLGGVPDDLG
ncbi:hypothetical protein ACFP63_08320 [Oerskovia jenensis]|uniref:AlgX/AlgJ SGNH hydrolase-like domain-containing protein n=1 Tax=Oerskovia jenensis TaxID=162169 RepID=A0ABS2LHZ6_9CELL|nr:hypothetical protein [Oerskovia jenensis]MBM7480056.1 hypothetical protein [Oerskovia jenensis]